MYNTGFFFFFPYITIVINLYGTVYREKKKKKKKSLFVLVFIAYTNIYLFFCFWFLCLLVFSICIVLVNFFFPYITIVVNLYSTAHGKNNLLYNYFCFWFLHLQHILVFINFLLLVFVFTGWCF
jgi:hypothetical protein